MSGFRLIDWINNGVAKPNLDYTLTLTFSYVSETCVKFVFDARNETDAVFHDLIIRKYRDYAKMKPCIETYPRTTFYPVEHVLDYDLEDTDPIVIFETFQYKEYGIFHSYIEITSTDDDQVGDVERTEHLDQLVGINSFGCQYPSVKIEGPWLEGEVKTHILPKSKKLILSATENVICETNPGYEFKWKAKLVSYDSNIELDGNTTLDEYFAMADQAELDYLIEGSADGLMHEKILAEKLEAAIQPRELAEGIWKVTIELTLIELKINVSDTVWISVIPSPLEIDIEGGERRTVGHGKTVQFLASAIDPDENDGALTKGIAFDWYVLGVNQTEMRPVDDYFTALSTNSELLPAHLIDAGTTNFEKYEMFEMTSYNEVRLSTNFFPMNEVFEIILVCSKDIRTKTFRQRVVAVAGDPPDFFIKCVENCKEKLNRGQTLSLMIRCKNCARARRPQFQWEFHLHDLIEQEEDDDYFEDYDQDDDYSSSVNELVNMQLLTDVPSITDSFTQRIMKVGKKYFLSGREYTIDVSVSMDGYDEETDSIVRQQATSSRANKVNLPPKDGYCTVESDTCDYITNEFYELVPNENSTARTIYNISESECSSSCCYGEALNCLAYQYSAWGEEKTGNCTLFDVTEDDDTVDMVYVFDDTMVSRFNRRVFAKLEAVKGEITIVCKNWVDEGTYLTYEEAEGRQAQLMFRFFTVPLNSSAEPFLLYHGPSPKTPKISLPLGEEHYYFFGLRIMAEICDAYGECVDSNEILVQALPMVSSNVGDQLMDTVAGNSSKLLTATSTKNAKIVAAITGAVSSYLKSNITNLSPDVIEATKATLLSTTARPVNRMVYSDKNDSPTPRPAHLDDKSDMFHFDISNMGALDASEPDVEEDEHDDETIETQGLSHAQNSAEEEEQAEENRRRLEEWRQSMNAAASNFLSDPSVIANFKRRRRFAMPKSEIDRRVRRNAEYFYDDYQTVGEDMYNYSFSSFTEYDYNNTDEMLATGAPVVEATNLEIDTNVKKQIKKNLMSAMGSVVDVVVSPESLLQVSDAISSFTDDGGDMEEETQKQGAEIATRMTANLKTFTDEADKEQMGKIGTKVMSGLSGIVGSSTPDDSALRNDKLSGKEPNYKALEDLDENPKENEWRRKFDRLKNRAEIKAKSDTAKNITKQSLQAVMDVGAAINTKQMMDEPAGEVKSGSLGITTEKINREDLANKKLRNAAGVAVKMPQIIQKMETQTEAINAQSSLGQVEVIEDDEVDIQMSTFDKNPLKYGDDAALMNSPVTVLNMPNGTEDILSQGITIEVPNSFSAEEQMLELHFPEQNAIQISRFEIVSPGNAILYLIEPPHDPNFIYNYRVYFRANKAPEVGEFQLHDYNFTLPHDYEIWEMDNPEIDKYKIFISEDQISCDKYPCQWYVGAEYWTLNVTENNMGIKRRRRRSVEDDENEIHHVFLSTPGCRVFDQETASWESQGCQVDHRSTPEHTECFCKDLPQQAVFSTQFFVPPNKIDFSTIWSKACIGCNPGVFSFVIVFLSVWLILAYFIHGWDKNDALKWQLRSLIDNRRRDPVLYQISACTGHYADSPTKSKLYFVINGERSKTRVRRLGTTKAAQLFDRSTTKHFLMRHENDLGELKSLQIWHDNTGNANLKGWYCQQVVITHVESGKRWFFMINDYLDAARSDGKCERLVPPADPDEGQNFHNLFVGTLSAKLTDDHIWLSVFHRPNKSNFSRLQRWTCCSGLTFLTMVANCMWSGKNDESSMIRVGPFKFSPTSVWISFISSVIVVPPMVLAVTLFKRARSKKEVPGKTAGCSNIKLPWWVKYISYSMNFLMTITCGFFTILYSFEFGKARADKWLLEELMSFAQNIILIEPCKVVFISLAIALILKKLDQSFLDSVEPHEIEDEDKRFLDLCSFEAEVDSQPLIPPKPPTEKQLEETKEVRYKEERMVEVIYDMIAYACYICIVIFIATGNRDPHAYGQNENIKNQFYYGADGFEKVASIDEFWTWVNTTVRTDLYPNKFYNEEKMNWRDRAFLRDGYSFRVGPARIRLQRGDPWSCEIFDYEKHYLESEPRDRCTRGEEYKGDYSVGWANEIISADIDEDDILEQAWIYRTWQELNGAPFKGKIGVHDGGGYSAELGVNQATCSFIVNHLYENAWIDHSATVTFVEFTIYNVNTNLFSQVRFAAEWLPSGGSSNSFSIKTFRPGI